MPSSRRTSQSPVPEYSDRPQPRRVRTPPTRPERYSVTPLPRHVVPAGAEDEETSAKSETERQAKINRRLRLKRRLTPWELAGFAVSCLACAFLLRPISGAQSDLNRVHNQVVDKQAQFRALDKQNSDEKNRLAHLKSEKGREQLLAEHGYLRPGDRILLFPTVEKPTPETEN